MGATARRWLLGVAAAAAMLPTVVAGARAVHDGWIPTWDNSYPAIRAWDVLSADPPLLGTRAGTASTYRGPIVHHPGPLEFVMLAPWVRALGRPAGTALGVAFLNGASIAAVAWLAHRRGGHAVAMVAVAAMATLAWSVGSTMLFDPWPPHVTLFPLAVLLMAGWSVADGDFAPLPLLAFSASFVLQTHLGYLLLAPGIVATSLALLGWRRLVERRARSAVEEPERGATPRRRWGLLGVVVALMCWAPPLYEQIAHQGGNVTNLINSAGRDRGPTLGFDVGVRLFAGTVALPPWWLPPSFGSPAVDVFGEGLSWPTALVSLVALTVLLAVAWRRAQRRQEQTLATGLAFLLPISILTLLTVDYAPSFSGIANVTYVRFVWVVAAFVGIVAVFAAIAEIRCARWPRVHAPGTRRVGLVVLAAAAVVPGVLALRQVDHSGTSPPWSIDATRELAHDVVQEVRGEGPVLVDFARSPVFLGPGLLVELQEAGVPIVVRDGLLVEQLGSHRRFERDSARLRLVVFRGPDGRPFNPRARLIAETTGLTTDQETELQELRRMLRAALERNRGLPLRTTTLPAWSRGFEEDIVRLIAAVEVIDDDPRDVLESEELRELVDLLQLLGLLEEVIDTDAFPVEALARYERLDWLANEHGARVFLEELD